MLHVSLPYPSWKVRQSWDTGSDPSRFTPRRWGGAKTDRDDSDPSDLAYLPPGTNPNRQLPS